MNEPTLAEKIRSACADLDLLVSGWRPPASVEAVHLDDWFPVVHRGLDLPALAGMADHPRLGRQVVTTSPVLWIDDDRTIARCVSRWYRLGQPMRIYPPSQTDGWVPVCELDDLRRLESRIASTRRAW